MAEGVGASRDQHGGASGVADALIVSNLNLSYGANSVVRDANLTIAAGEFVTLLGPSGSGKTSILRAVAGYVSPSSGSIRIHGRDVVGMPPRRRNCGMVFQNYALFPHMTVTQNVAFGLRARDLSRSELRDRVAQMLEVVGLIDLAARYPHQLSGGQQQRVALARALVIRPALLLMDEPLSALDRQLRDRMQDEIRAIQQKFAISTLYVTHDQGEAFSMSDRIIVINDGRIVAAGAPREVYLKPPSSFAAQFVGTSTLLSLPARQEGQPPALPGQPRRFRFRRPVSRQTERVFLSIRPEMMRCTREPHPGATEGVVRARRFVGTSVLLILDVGGHEMVAIDPNGYLRVNDAAYVSWELNAAHVIEETEAGVPCTSDGQGLVAAEADTSRLSERASL